MKILEISKSYGSKLIALRYIKYGKSRFSYQVQTYKAFFENELVYGWIYRSSSMTAQQAEQDILHYIKVISLQLGIILLDFNIPPTNNLPRAITNKDV